MSKHPEHFSPSAWSRWEQCPRSWALRYVEGIPDPGSVDTVHGLIVHRTLELLMMHDGPARTTDLREDLLEISLDEHAEQIEAVGSDRSAMKVWSADTMLGWTATEPGAPYQADVLHVEQRLELEVGGVPLVLIVDRIDRRKGQTTTTCVAKDYKGLALDTALVTPSGWTTMAEVQVGDQVFDMDGTPTNVTAKSEVHFNPTYRITFDDQSSLVADHEHRWVVDLGDRRVELTTVGLGKAVDERSGRNPTPSVAVAEPLIADHLQLELHPYLLGLWLADGNRTCGSICVGKSKLPAIARLGDLGYRVAMAPAAQRESEQRDRFAYTVYGIRSSLQALGVLGNKHIPAQYLRASVDQRVELLRGLMDGDGSWNATRGQAVINTTNKAMALQIRELVTSLGYRVALTPYTAKGFGLIKDAYLVAWRPWRFNPFLRRIGNEQVGVPPHRMATRRYVQSVERVHTAPTQCITVDSPTSTYLAGESMIPTHNSGKRAKMSAAYTRQMVLSAIAAEQITGLPCPTAEVWFVKVAEIKVVRTGAAAQATVTEDLQRAWRNVAGACIDEDFPPRPSPLCNWCNYQDRCPEGQRAARAWREKKGLR